MDVPPPPDIIGVPNLTLYRDIQAGDFKEYLDATYDEGWKLHIPLPDSGYLIPHGDVIFWRNSRRFRLSAIRYYTSPVEERQNDNIEQNLGFVGYSELFVYLQKKKVPHKFVPTVTLLRQMEQYAGQEGKFLTIYPRGHEELLKVASHAEKSLGLMNSKGCFNASKRHQTVEKRVPALGIITARYGSFVDPYVMKPANQMPKKIDMNNGVTGANGWGMHDDRTKYKPDHIRDPWTGSPPKGDWGWNRHPEI